MGELLSLRGWTCRREEEEKEVDGCVDVYWKEDEEEEEERGMDVCMMG